MEIRIRVRKSSKQKNRVGDSCPETEELDNNTMLGRCILSSGGPRPEERCSFTPFITESRAYTPKNRPNIMLTGHKEI